MNTRIMQWKEFRDNLGGLKVDGSGYHAPTKLIKINDFPTDIYIVAAEYRNSPWVTAMGFVWSSEDKYNQSIFTGIEHITFTHLTQLISSCQSSFMKINSDKTKFKIDEAHALIMAAYDFSKFQPKYEECLSKSINSIIAQVRPIDQKFGA